MAERQFSTRRKVAFLAIILFFSFLLFIVVGEIAFRIGGKYRSYSEVTFGTYRSLYECDGANWLMLHRPNHVSQYQTVEYQYEVKTNSLGLRDIEHSANKPDSVKRIIALGDSFTEGQGAPYDSTYPRFVEQNLNHHNLTDSIEMIVAGVLGSDPFHNYKLLEMELLKFHPDLVLLTVNSSDIKDYIARGGEERFLPNGRINCNEAPWITDLYAISHLARFVVHDILDYDATTLLSKPMLNRKAEEAMEATRRKLDEYIELGKQHNFELLVVIHPFSPHLIFDGKYEYQAMHHFIEKLEKDKIPYIDIMAYYRKNMKINMSTINTYFWLQDSHPNFKGYKLFAKGVTEKIVEMGVFKELD